MLDLALCDSAPAAMSPSDERAGSAEPSSKRSRFELVVVEPKPKGFLWRFHELSLDIISQVLSELEPLDLLRVARTSKSWRRIVLNPSFAFVWHRAFANLPDDFPPLLGDVDPPKLASLVFEPVCAYCGREWDDWWSANFTVFRVTLCRPWCERGWVSRPVLRTDSQQGWDLEPLTLELLQSRLEEGNERFYHLPDVERMSQTLRRLASQGPEALNEFVLARKRVLKRIKKHTSAIRRWSGRWREAQRLRVSRVRQQRLEFVQDRLLENGIEKDELKWARPVSDMAVGGAGKMAMTYYEWGEIGPSVLEQARQMVDARREESQQPKLPRTIPCERCPGKRFRRAFDLEQHCIKMHRP